MAEKVTWNMIRSWINHGLVTATFGLLGFVAGGSMWTIAWAGGYFFREVRQHEVFGTQGSRQWLDRIMDALVPILVALGFAVWM